MDPKMHTPERPLLYRGWLWVLGGVPFLEEGVKRALFFPDPALSICPRWWVLQPSSLPRLLPPHSTLKASDL